MNSFFTFDTKLYFQCDGLFMGSSPSPPAAIIAVYKMERNSIYVDSYFISSYISDYYCRYVDDNSSLGPDRSYVQQVCDMISEQDPRGGIKWEIDFPRDNAFVPFLDTELKITPEGELKTRYFRKPQDKGTIAKSHHLRDMKKKC